MSLLPTRPIDAHRAGRLILAVADDDRGQVLALMQEMVSDPDPTAQLLFMLEQAAITVGLAETHIGSGWRDVLSMALLDTEAEHLSEDG